MILSIIPVLLGSLLVCGKDLSIPSGWRSPTSNRSPTERAQIAQNVIDTITPLYNSGSKLASNLSFGQNGHMLSSISLHDFFSSSQANNDIVNQWLGANADGFTKGTGTWAVAAANAYRAYGDSRWLNMAVAVWNQVNSGCTITADVAANGVMTGKNVTVPGQCNGKTTAGGTFFLGNDPASLLVNMDTMGGFMSLSALLLEATGNQMYATAVKAAFEFVQAHLYDGQIMTRRIDLSTCTVFAGGPSSGCGFVIESLSIYLNKTSDQSVSDFFKTLIPSCVNFPGFTSSNGVNSEGPTIDKAEVYGDYNAATANKAIFIRGLHEAWSRMDKNSDLAQFIQSYVIVQYNALLDLAQSSSGGFYSPRWQGPPATQFIPWGQFTASNVMNAALSMSLTNTTRTGDGTSGSDGSTQRHTNVGAIVGATIGGVVIAIVMAFVILFVIRRRRRSIYGNMTYDGDRLSLDGIHEATIYTTTPYTATSFTQGNHPPTFKVFKSSVPALVPSAIGNSSHDPSATEQESIPELVYRLNRAIAAQPVVTNADEASNAPPEYESVAGDQAPRRPMTKQRV
ncbi:hypothetical protein QCA50_008083 [Cerrena zonata]|uniref:Glycoside hydrolase family 76 protein n=1 Tax=Cerrena zonata TaxID=2478898 RepID=A0AAW0G4X9_9APHY